VTDLLIAELELNLGGLVASQMVWQIKIPHIFVHHISDLLDKFTP